MPTAAVHCTGNDNTKHYWTTKYHKKLAFNSLSCSLSASLALEADQYDAQRMVPTAMSHKNTSAMSTTERFGEYSCTDTG